MALDASEAPGEKRQSSFGPDPWILILVLATCVTLPAVLLGDMLKGVDSHFHARWSYYFSSQIWNGEFYPRWLMDMNGGFGSPALFIYPPLSQFVTALLYPFFPGLSVAPALLGFSIWLAIATSGITCFCWLRVILPGRRLAATMGAIAYLLAPYHLYVDVYQRGAVAEVWAFVWPPLSLLFVHRLDRFRPAQLAWLAVSIGGLLVTHAPSSLILIPGYFLYALLLDWQDRHLCRAMWLVPATMLGCLLAGWYLGTALTHTRYINTSALFDGRNAAVRWLIGGGVWPDPMIQRDIYITAGLVGAITLVAGVVALRKSDRGERGLPLAALLLGTASVLMMSILSKPVWDLGLPINQVQFPWRFSGMLSLAGALAVGLFCRHFDMFPRALALIPAMMLAANVLLYCFPARYPAARPETLAAKEPFDNSWDAPEYRLASKSKVEGIFAPGEKAHFASGEGTVSVSEWRPRSLTIAIDSKTASVIAVRQFDYPGWVISSPSQDTELKLVKGKPYLQVEAQAGKHTIHLSLSETTPESVGQLSSGLASILIFGLFGAGWVMSRRKQQA